jgi:DNA mismatch repair protein MutL
LATNIRILPENLTNKIAAGEVVERPASVAKELVENALDAGAKEVIVEIDGGGRRLIKVTDTGCGMSREDALLCLERHATSKIACDDDLFSLSTLGFRGEALPSIASVSRLTISTRTSDNVEGTEIYAEGGRIKEVKECGMAAGTIIAVRNLFFNTPARLKFMKSAETEGGHVGELLTRLAISRPDVRFTYINDGKVIFKALDAQLRDRVATMLGRPIAASLYPVSYQDATGLAVSGLVAAPECSRSAGSHLYTYINGRFIRDKVVQHAILQAYRNFLERGRYPVVAVFIEIAPGEVDVNVHPTKHEVRFREQGRVHDAIQQAVESVLRTTPWLKRAEPQKPVTAATSNPRQGIASGCAAIERAVSAPSPRDEVVAVQPEPQSINQPSTAGGDVSAAKVAEVKELLVNFQPRPQPALRPYFQPAPRSERRETEEIAHSASAVGFPHPSPVPGGEGTAAEGLALSRTVKEGEGTILPKVVVAEVTEVAADGRDNGLEGSGYFSSLSVIGQFNASYIVCQRGTDLVLIDQHAAHERVAFEKLKREFSARGVDSQGLLFPETIDLSFRESAVLLENLEGLAGLGFELEEFGGNTWLLKGVPQVLAGADYLRTLRDILEELGSLGRSRTFTDIQEDILARLACHSVVRGRRPLTQQEIAALFTQMDETDFSSNCPHGRPVMQAMTLAEIEKMFKRG